MKKTIKQSVIKIKKPFVVGLTGGIGSGKTQVARFFSQKGIPVYDTDMAAKKLMAENLALKENIIKNFGKESYTPGGEINRPYLSTIVFNDPVALQKLNSIVHPVVFDDFKNWLTKQTSKWVVKESAILYESGAYKSCNLIVAVAADTELRLQRVMARDKTSRDHILKRMAQQWTEKQRNDKAHFCISNNGSIMELEEKFNNLFKGIETTLFDREAIDRDIKP